MRILNVLILLVVLLSLPGCSWLRTDINQLANDTTIPWGGANILVPDPAAEKILFDAFVGSSVPWGDGQELVAQKARFAIDTQFDFWMAKLTLDGTIPYYNYKAGFEYVQYNYQVLQGVLDQRVKAGALTVEQQIIYTFVRDNIANKLELQRKVISAAETGINDQATELSIEQMKEVYGVMKPLITTAGAALL